MSGECDVYLTPGGQDNPGLEIEDHSYVNTVPLPPRSKAGGDVTRHQTSRSDDSYIEMEDRGGGRTKLSGPRTSERAGQSGNGQEISDKKGRTPKKDEKHSSSTVSSHTYMELDRATMTANRPLPALPPGERDGVRDCESAKPAKPPVYKRPYFWCVTVTILIFIIAALAVFIGLWIGT